MGDLKFSDEVLDSGLHRRFGWKVGANHAAHEAYAAQRLDPAFRDLEADLANLPRTNFEREILLAQREGRVETMIPKHASISPDSPDSTVSRDRR